MMPSEIRQLTVDGHFALTLSFVLMCIGIGAAVGATVSFGTTVYEDYKDDGEIFNGSIGWDEYLGNTLGGSVAGLGIGLYSALGVGLGIAWIAGEATFACGSLSLSYGAWFTIGVGSAFVSGGAGYALRTAINSQESFDFSEMMIESTFNALSGLVSLSSNFFSGAMGIKPVGKSVSSKITGFLIHQLARLKNK